MQNVVEDWLEKTLLPYVLSSSPKAQGDLESSNKVEALPSYARSKKSENPSSRQGTINALEELQFDRDSLSAYGLDKLAQEKIYRSFYVHCHGIHELIRTYQGVHPDMSTKMWEVFIAVFQYYDPELRQSFLNYLKENQDKKTVRVIERLTETVEQLTEENEKLKNDNLKLQVARTSAEYEQQMTNRLDQRMNNALQEKVQFYQNQLREKEEFIEKLNSSLTERREASQLSESLLLQLSKQHMNILQEIQMLRNVRKDLEKEVGILKSKNLALDKTIVTLREELMTVKDELRQETRAHLSLQDQHVKVTEELDLVKESGSNLLVELKETKLMERTTHETLLEVIKLFNAVVFELQQFLIASDQLEGISKCTKRTLGLLSAQMKKLDDYRYVNNKSKLPEKLKCMTMQDFIVDIPPPKPKKVRRRKVVKEEASTPVEGENGNAEAIEYNQEGSSDVKEKEKGKEEGEQDIENEDEEEEEEEEEETGPPPPDRKKYLNELVETSRSWARFLPSLGREYFSISQQPILRDTIVEICRKCDELIPCQQEIRRLQTRNVSALVWQNDVLVPIVAKQRQQILLDVDIRLGLESVIRERDSTIVELEQTIAGLNEVKENYDKVEPKFLQLVEIYKQSVRDKKDVEGLLQEARDRIALFEKMEVEFKATRNRLEDTQNKLEEKEAYVTYLRNEQRKLASKSGADRRRTIKRPPGAKDNRGSFLEQLRRSFSSSTNNLLLNADDGDTIGAARDAAVRAVLNSDSKDTGDITSTIGSPSGNRRGTDAKAPNLSTIMRMDSNKLRRMRSSFNMSGYSIDERDDHAHPVDEYGRRLDEKDLDDLETVIAEASDALVESLLAIAEMVQMSLEMQENGKRIHQQHHGEGGFTEEGTLLMKCVEKVEHAVQSLKDHRDNVFYDVSYKLDPSIKKELLTIFDSMMHMPQHMLQIMKFADELFDVQYDKDQVANELELVKQYSVRERLRLIKLHDEQVFELKQTIAHLQS